MQRLSASQQPPRCSGSHKMWQVSLAPNNMPQDMILQMQYARAELLQQPPAACHLLPAT